MSRRATTAVGALLSATVLASGSAAAQPAPDDVGIAQQGDIVLNEIGAELDPFSGVTGGFIEIMNIGSTPDVSIGGWEVVGCTNSDSFSVVINVGVELDPGETYLLGDFSFVANPFGNPPNQRFGSGEVLEQASGGVNLIDPFLTDPVDEVTWGSPPHFDCAGPDAGILPDDDHSIQQAFLPPWCRAIPTPGGANGPCVQ